MRKLGLALFLSLGTAAGAETIVFEADGGVVFARCTEEPAMTICELLFPQGTPANAYACVALDGEGTPIGVVAAPDLLFPSAAWFQELPASQIANVQCRRR